MNPLNDPSQMTALVTMFLGQLPMLIVSVLGCAVVMARRNELGGAATWALMGFGLSIVLGILIPLAQTFFQHWVIESGGSISQRASVLTVLGLFWSVLRAVSFGLLLMAIVAGRRRSEV